MEKKHTGGINIGTSSILVTFVLLALVTFAALSYLSANSDYVLSCEAAQRTASYYDANRMAEIYMANIEGLLSKHFEKVHSEEEYYDGIENLFKDNDNITVEKIDDRINLSYQVAITKGQNLEVTLIANYPGKSDERLFYIDKWSTSANQEWINEVIENEDSESKIKLLF